jgi:hypothetical protein
MREIGTYLKAAGPVLWFKPILTIVLCTSHLAAALIYWATWYDSYRFYRFLFKGIVWRFHMFL